MKTIIKEVTNELIIQKSKFIGIINHIDKVEEAKDILLRVKKEYPKATHYCYGYICNGIQKSNDDGEPSSTAGKPILESIIKNNLTNVMVIVVRYFGGVKLGAGGLTRAYVEATTGTIKKAEIYRYEIMSIYEVKIDYSLYDAFRRYCQNNYISIDSVNYFESVELIISSKDLDIEGLKQFLLNKVEIKFIKEDEVLVKMEEK